MNIEAASNTLNDAYYFSQEVNKHTIYILNKLATVYQVICDNKYGKIYISMYYQSYLKGFREEISPSNSGLNFDH